MNKKLIKHSYRHSILFSALPFVISRHDNNNHQIHLMETFIPVPFDTTLFLPLPSILLLLYLFFPLPIYSNADLLFTHKIIPIKQLHRGGRE